MGDILGDMETVEDLLSRRDTCGLLDHIENNDAIFTVTGMNPLFADNDAACSRQKRRMAVLIHPDRCKDPRAENMSKKLMGKFDDIKAG